MLRSIRKILYRSIESREISYEKLKKMMQKEDAILIDVRSNQEYQEGHLNGAINIPVYDIEKMIIKIVKNKNDTIILYCSSGQRSKSAKEILEKLGYNNVFTLKNGIEII